MGSVHQTTLDSHGIDGDVGNTHDRVDAPNEDENKQKQVTETFNYTDLSIVKDNEHETNQDRQNVEANTAVVNPGENLNQCEKKTYPGPLDILTKKYDNDENDSETYFSGIVNHLTKTQNNTSDEQQNDERNENYSVDENHTRQEKTSDITVDEEHKNKNFLSASDITNTTSSTQANVKSSLKSCEENPPASKKRKKGITFNSVDVFYFPRTQGFTCVPSQGGATLGMTRNHTHTKSFSLGEHAAEQRRMHKQLCTENWEAVSAASTEDDSDSEEMFSDQDTDYENCNFLQPISTRERRTLLKAAGVRKIDSGEKDECRAIRVSREYCGCTCQVYCNPETCVCAQAGIKCQVDRMNFPCSCSRDGCANQNGRIEFNPARVRNHYIQTLMRLEMEKKKEEEQRQREMYFNQFSSYSMSTGTPLLTLSTSTLDDNNSIALSDCVRGSNAAIDGFYDNYNNVTCSSSSVTVNYPSSSYNHQQTPLMMSAADYSNTLDAATAACYSSYNNYSSVTSTDLMASVSAATATNVGDSQTNYNIDRNTCYHDSAGGGAVGDAPPHMQHLGRFLTETSSMNTFHDDQTCTSMSRYYVQAVDDNSTCATALPFTHSSGSELQKDDNDDDDDDDDEVGEGEDDSQDSFVIQDISEPVSSTLCSMTNTTSHFSLDDRNFGEISTEETISAEGSENLYMLADGSDEATENENEKEEDRAVGNMGDNDSINAKTTISNHETDFGHIIKETMVESVTV